MTNPTDEGTRWRWLPPIGSWKYHAMLLAIGALVLGPLAGLTAAYMAFSLGFVVGGGVLAGLLGSLVTLGYGAEGKHGANLIQTTAASVASMGAMASLIQALVWLGLPQLPLIPLMLYLLCIGMFGVGVGMLYTPILVDRLKLPFPSGLAVANILRTLTDRTVLRRAIARLAGGIGLGFVGAVAGVTVPLLKAAGLSMSTLGAGMVVGTRIAFPALTGGLAFTLLMPTFIDMGWLAPGEPYRKIGFVIAVGALLGAAAVDLSALLLESLRRIKAAVQSADIPVVDNTQATIAPWRLWLWTTVWATAIVCVGSLLLNQPVGYLLFAIGAVFVFALINGLASGVSDFSPISAGAVITVLLMAAMGLRDPAVGLTVSVVMFVATMVASDMQQDRSTGWRLGTSRVLQFRYQTAGVVVGAIATVTFAHLFLTAYPVLKLDQTVMAAADQPAQWSSAATYKIVGILHGLAEDSSKQRSAIWLGVALGLVMQLARRWLKSRAAYQRLAQAGKRGAAAEWVIDTLLLPLPYAFFFGGFVSLPTTAWFATGGVLAALLAWRSNRARKRQDVGLPPDMSTVSLVGGGLIAGESLAALTVAIGGLISLI